MAVLIQSGLTGSPQAFANANAHSQVDYDPTLSRMWVCYTDGPNTDVVVEYSDNGGATWQRPTSGASIDYGAGLRWNRRSMQVTADSAVWVTYGNSNNYPCVRRGTMSGTTMTWSSEEVIQSVLTNQTHSGDFVVFPWDGGYQIFASFNNLTSGDAELWQCHWTSGGGFGTWTKTGVLYAGTSFRMGLEFRHPTRNRLSVQKNTPDVFASYHYSSNVYLKVAAWNGSGWTLGSEGMVANIGTGVITSMIYDGAALMFAHGRLGGSNDCRLWQRDIANTTTWNTSTPWTTPTLTNLLLGAAITWDADRNIYLTTMEDNISDAGSIRTIKWTRSGPTSGSFAGSWTTVESTRCEDYYLCGTLWGQESGYVEHFWFDDVNDNLYVEQGVAITAAPDEVDSTSFGPIPIGG